MPNADEKRMRELRERLGRLRGAPGTHTEGIDEMLAELAYYESLPHANTPEAVQEWADREHIAAQLGEIEAALRWEENRLGAK